MNANPGKLLRWLVLALIVLGLGWELWWAPLRSGGSFLALKVIPLVLILPGIWRNAVRSKQILSMLILLYVTEGVVRAMSDSGWQARLGIIELALSSLIFVLIMLEFQQRKRLHALASASSAESSPPPPSP